MAKVSISSVRDGEQLGASRRDFLKKAALAAGSAPFIVTTMAGRATATHQGCIHRQQTCTVSVTTPQSQCCASDNFGSMVCCSVGTKIGTCNGGAGATCSNNAQCCNSSCINGVCQI